MAKVTVTSYQYEKEPTIEVYEGEVDATISPQEHLLILDNSALKPKLRAIYAKGTWDKVTLDD